MQHSFVICPDWPRLAQIGPDWPRLAQIGADWRRLAQIGPIGLLCRFVTARACPQSAYFPAYTHIYATLYMERRFLYPCDQLKLLPKTNSGSRLRVVWCSCLVCMLPISRRMADDSIALSAGKHVRKRVGRISYETMHKIKHV